VARGGWALRTEAMHQIREPFIASESFSIGHSESRLMPLAFARPAAFTSALIHAVLFASGALSSVTSLLTCSACA
jgi:hypothetical protein